MIQVHKHSPQTLEHFDPAGRSLGFLNEIENIDLRCQIAEQSANGYYLIFNGERIEIDAYGKFSQHVPGVFDSQDELLTRLFNAQLKKRTTAS